MIRLYYTGAKSFLEEQRSPSKSLGGYISSSAIPNALINNLYADISYSNLQEGVQQLRVIALKNEGISTLVNVTAHIEHIVNKEGIIDNMADFYIGYATPKSDDCGIYGEKVENEEAEPYQSELQKSSGELQKISLLNIEKDQFVLLYLQRRIIINELSEQEEIDAIRKAYEEKTKTDRVENVQLVFNYS